MNARKGGDKSPRGPNRIDAASLAGLALPEPLLELVRRRGVLRRLVADERLFSAGDPVPGVHLVLDGAIRILREAPGRNVVVHRETRGGLLGDVAFFAAEPYPGTAVALEPTLLVLLRAEDVRSAIAASPELTGFFLHRLATRAREVIGRLDRLAHLTVGRRLAAHLVTRVDGARRGAASVTLGMTQQQLAEELGTVKEIITRELRTLVRAGIIDALGAGRYRVADRDGLMRLADRSAPRTSKRGG